MDYTTIINTLINYGSLFLFIMAALVFAVNIIVEVIKTAFSKIPTSYLTIVVSIVASVLALFIAAAVLKITVMWYYAVGAVVLGIFVAYAAMFGFDKFKEAWEHLQQYSGKK